ncbi:MAG TPA: sensor domain-containing diguanylate cyclase [Candidatus Saccharimonadales bacterium]|nr:sensor domain-containing diguanylate cyclase [Candidatus Saccharimonadales bacterium]
MTRPSSGEDRPDNIPGPIGSAPDSISDVMDIVDHNLSQAAEKIGSLHSDDRKVGAQALISAALFAESSIEVGKRLEGLLSFMGTEGQVDKDSILHTFSAEIRKVLELQEALIGGTHDVVVVLDLEDYISFVNSAITEVTGYEVDGLSDIGFGQVVYEEDLQGVTDRLKKAKNSDNEPFEFRVVCLDGSIKWMLASTNILRDRGSPCGITVTMKDISQQKELEETNKKLATYDELTGLYSRNALITQLDKLRVSYRRYPMSMLVADIDDFKKTNDKYGHTFGDELLKVVSRILRNGSDEDTVIDGGNGLREMDFIARYGGDEFMIPLPEADEDAAAQVVQRMNDSFDLYNKTHEVPIYVSIGSATTNDVEGFNGLVDAADEEMYKVKRKRKRDKKKSNHLKSQLEE